MYNTNEIPEPLTKNIRFLTPSIEADKYKTYDTALTKGIEEPSVTNIAISGPYGSGKSSVIKTYIHNQENKNEFLQISLANFEPKGDDMGQMIEKSILQQMFYKVENSKVPYSKLKRIIAPDSIIITKTILFIMTFSALLYLLLNPKELVSIIEDTSMIYGVVFLFLSMVFYGLYLTAAALKNVKLSKIAIKDAEFNLAGEGDNISLINRHLDEILYFFEATTYRTLIIEDLDRFDNVAIFEKLRELNTLINNYDKIKTLKGKITFIYAIKDNFFIGENRSKFFDLIIPVVPYINSAGNARDPLVKELRAAGISEGAISEQLLKNISKFIHDHRFLINIINEYLTYLNEFNPGLKEANKLDMEKLFCMIVYKNFFPADFADLHQSKGWLFDFFHKKKKAAEKKLILSIDTEIDKVRGLISGSEQENLTHEIELRAIYIQKVLSDSNLNPKTIQINNANSTTKEIIEHPGKFQIFMDSARILHYSGTSQYIAEAPLVHDIKFYEERLRHVQNKDKNKLLELKQGYSSLQIKRSLALGMSMASIIKDGHADNAFDDIGLLYENAGYKDQELKHKLESPNILRYFIREAKISEDYASYISYFHEGGALSRADNDFIIKVIEGQKVDPNHNIDNPRLAISDLDVSKFLDPAILNINIVNEIYASLDNYRTHATYIHRVLQDNSIANEFIPEFLSKKGVGIQGFIGYFTENDPLFWSRLESFGLDRDALYYVLSNMLEVCEKDTILSQGELIVDFIYQAGDYLFSQPNTKQTSMLMMLLPEMGRKFSHIEKPIGAEGEKLLFECIYDFNLYELNPYMIALIIKVIDGQVYADNIPNEQIAEYADIRASTLTKLITYVEENIDDYVEHVYLLSLNNEEYSESYAAICSLISHEELDEGLKYAIIKKMKTIIEKLTDIVFEKDLCSELFEKLKIKPTWENVYEYNANMEITGKIDDPLIKFLAHEEVAKALITTDKAIPEGVNEVNFDKAIVFDERISALLLNIYRPHIKPFNDISDIESVEIKKFAEVIDSDYIRVNQNNYEFLRDISQSSYSDLHIKLLETDFQKAKEFIFETEFVELDAMRILMSNKIDILDRYQYLQGLELDLLSPDHRLADPIANILNVLKDNEKIKFKMGLFQIAVKSSLTIDSKIALFLKQVTGLPNEITNEQIYQFLTDLGGHYSELIPSESGKSKFDFSNNKFNRRLFEILKGLDLVGKVNIEDDRDEIVVHKKRKIKLTLEESN